MKSKIYMKLFNTVFLYCCMTSCSDFVEVDVPDNKIVSEVVFNNDEMVISAMKGIYNQLFESSFSNGGSSSVTALVGLSSDNLTTIRKNDLVLLEFDQNEIFPDNERNLNLWTSTYNIIYMTNALLDGVTNSNQITEDVRNQVEGEAKFIRAFAYFYLVNLYGEVPLPLTTNYRVNALASRNQIMEVYQQIIIDLLDAIDVLEQNYKDGERTYVNVFVAKALLARVQLYLQDWEEAENLSSEVISQTGTYEILEDLDQVFLANSREAIWQLSPLGRGNIFIQTNEGGNFIIHPLFPALSKLKLSEKFISSQQPGDKRFIHWINFHEELGAYYPFKYKIRESTSTDITEYSMVLRLAEQYLIRAEARTMQGNLSGAITDLDIIRNRAGLSLIKDMNSEIGKEELLDMIIKERKNELFTEWGHRWLDLKRTGRVNEVLGVENPKRQDSDLLFPIPEEERLKNPNLGQNIGY